MAADSRVTLHLDLDSTEAEKQLDELRKEPDKLPVEVEITGAEEAQQILDAIPETKTVDIDVVPDTASIAEVENALTGTEKAWEQVKESAEAAEKPIKEHTSLLSKLKASIGSTVTKIRQFGTEGKDAGKKTEEGFKGSEKAAGSLGTALSALSGTLGSVFAVTKIIAWGKACIEASSGTENALRGLSSVLDGQGRSFEGARGFIDDYIADGLVPLEDAVTSYKNLAARGYDDTQIRRVMTALKDSAAYGRQAGYTLGEAVSGATEGLKNENSVLVDNAGVTKNVAKMWDEYAKAIGTNAQALTQQQKIEAEVNGILAETRFQEGDAAKVAGTFSGQTAQLTANLDYLKTGIGDLLKNAIAPYLEYINRAIKGTGIFLETINKTLGISTDLSGSQGLAAGMQQAASNTDGLTDALRDANKQAEKLLGASFDDFNVIGGTQQEQNAAPGSVSAALDSDGLGEGADKAAEQTDALREKAEDFAAQWLDGFQTLKEKFALFKQDWGAGWDTIKRWFAQFREDWSTGWQMLENFGGKVYDFFHGWGPFWEGVGGKVYDVVQGAKTKVAGIWSKLKTGVKNGVDWTKKQFQNAKDGILKKFEPVAGWFKDQWTTIKNTWSVVSGWFKEQFQKARSNLETAFSPVTDWMKQRWELIRGVWSVVSGWFKEQFQKAKSNLETAFSPVTDWMRQKWDAVKNIWSAAPDWFRQRFDDAKSLVQTSWQRIGEWFSDRRADVENAWNSFHTWMSDKASSAWNGIKDAFSNAESWFKELRGKIEQPFSNIADWFRDRFSDAWQRVLDVFSNGGAAFNGIKDGISNVFRNQVNGIIDGLNTVLSKSFEPIDKAVRTLKSWYMWTPWGEFWPFSDLPYVNMPSIPRLAKGGLVRQPTLAMVGDNPNAKSDPEVVSPLSKLRSILPQQGDSAAQILLKLDSMIQLLELLIELVGGIDPCITIGDKDIYTAAKRGEKQYQRMRGAV